MTKRLPDKQNLAIQVDNLLLNLVVDVTAEVANSRLIASLHRHSYTELFVCKSGQIQIKTEDRTYHLLPGDAAIAPSGLTHLRTPSLSAEAQWASIGFFCSECIGCSGSDFYTPVARLAEQRQIVVYHGQASLYDTVDRIRNCSDAQAALSGLLDFAAALVRLSQTLPSVAMAANGEKRSKNKNIDRLLKLDHFINHEFMNPLTCKRIANALHLSERQLSRLVLTHYGTTLHALLLRKRISVAAKLLSESTDTIEAIALAVGFKGKMNFYREFKKIHQMTPTQYRLAASGKPGCDNGTDILAQEK